MDRNSTNMPAEKPDIDVADEAIPEEGPNSEVEPTPENSRRPKLSPPINIPMRTMSDDDRWWIMIRERDENQRKIFDDLRRKEEEAAKQKWQLPRGGSGGAYGGSSRKGCIT